MQNMKMFRSMMLVLALATMASARHQGTRRSLPSWLGGGGKIKMDVSSDLTAAEASDLPGVSPTASTLPSAGRKKSKQPKASRGSFFTRNKRRDKGVPLPRIDHVKIPALPASSTNRKSTPRAARGLPKGKPHGKTKQRSGKKHHGKYATEEE